MEAPGKLLPEKVIRGDCVARFPKPVPYLKPKAAMFPSLLTCPKIGYHRFRRDANTLNQFRPMLKAM